MARTQQTDTLARRQPLAKRTATAPGRISRKPLPRVAIENVRPRVDDGRYPAKRLLGDEVHIGADIYKDGHGLLAARVCYKSPGKRAWSHVSMSYDYDRDRWSAAFVVDCIGRWTYTVEAWPDAFASWRHDLEKRVGAGQDVRSELIEGAALIERALAQAKSSVRTALRTSLAVLRDEDSAVETRIDAALSSELAALMATVIDRDVITRYDRQLDIVVDRQRAGFAAWYEMFPRSQVASPDVHGTFRDAESRLPALADLGFDVIYLPPIHPVGTTKRKGPNNTLPAGPDDPGSPWAIGNRHGGHTAVDPRLGTIDDFVHFVSAARELGMEVALDNAIQCSPDHPWLKEHPEWFFVRPDGTIKYAENPPKKYEDIYPLNFWCDDWESLWEACRDIFLFWIEKGVRTFRVDNPHTKPLAFWEWVIREIHQEHPDVAFLSEAFTRPKRMKGLAKLGFTQSYTYFTWRNTAAELREYLTELTQTEMVEYFRPNFFANTPDILHEYLQKGGRPAFRIRLLLAATLSPLYGIYSGFELCENEPLRPGSEEYVHSEKYEIRVRDWNAPGNINDDIRRINQIRRACRALQQLANVRFCATDNDQILCYVKLAYGEDLIIAVNVDPHNVQHGMVDVPLTELGLDALRPYGVEDLLSGDRYTWRGSRNYVRLDPARQVGHILRILRDRG